MSLFLQNLDEHRTLFQRLDALGPRVDEIVRQVAQSLRDGGKVMFCGNGGSAADSQHLAAEFTGRFIRDRRPLAGLALSTDSSALTCIANDYGYADVFARQVVALGRRGDCLVGISTSGNSSNVVHAFEAAQNIGITTIGLLGGHGGRLAALSDYPVIVPSDVTARVQEAHILIGHSLCGGVEMELGCTG